MNSGRCNELLEEKNPIINLTQHRATEGQKKEGVVDPPEELRLKILEDLTFNYLPKKDEMQCRAHALAGLVANKGYNLAMIGGAPFFMPVLERALLLSGIIPLYAFSKRESVEETIDGKVIKKGVFKHLGFIQGTVELKLFKECPHHPNEEDLPWRCTGFEKDLLLLMKKYRVTLKYYDGSAEEDRDIEHTDFEGPRTKFSVYYLHQQLKGRNHPTSEPLNVVKGQNCPLLCEAQIDNITIYFRCAEERAEFLRGYDNRP